MKKILLLLLVVLCPCVAFSQTKVKFKGTRDIKVQFKRCVVKDNTAYIDVVFFNQWSSNFNYTLRAKEKVTDNSFGGFTYRTKVENTIGGIYYPTDYNGNIRMLFSAGGATLEGINKDPSLIIPGGNIPIKGRIVIKDIGSDVNSFKLVQVCFKAEKGSRSFRLILKNVPITRE